MPGPRFTDIRHFDTIDSTNRYLLDQARAGAAAGVVAVADHQSAGRGRLGRRWEAPPGANLLVSVLLRSDLPVAQAHLASVVVALAALDAVEGELGVELVVKWPNDLLSADGRKVAGVLAEADLPTGTGPAQPGTWLGPPVVVGIGLNVNWPAEDSDLPPDLVGTTTSLRQLTGRVVDRPRLLAALLEALEPRVADLETAAGRAVQADRLRARCVTVGSRVRVELADDRFEGTASAVTEEGHLVVDVDGDRRTVVAGDVVHLRTSS